ESNAIARATPTTTTSAETRGIPPAQAQRPTGESAWEKARRPPGQPPDGITDRASSNPTQRIANTVTWKRTRVQITAPRRAQDQAAANRATKPASATDSATHGTTPTANFAQVMCGRKNARPKVRPTRVFHQALSRPRAMKSRATPRNASGHQ